MLKIHYFASVREHMGVEVQEFPWAGENHSVAQLILSLEASDSKFAALHTGTKSLLVAVNQIVVERGYVLSDGDEVAFFPPMTGG